MRKRFSSSLLEVVRSPAVLIQFLVLLFLFCNEFGFDHASKSGLDFGHLVLGVGIYLVSLLWGIGSAFYRKKPGLVIVQLMLFPIFFTFKGMNEPSTRTKKSYQASEYQHLISKSEEEVMELLGTPLVSGGGGLPFYSYGQIEILFSEDKKVVSVKSK